MSPWLNPRRAMPVIVTASIVVVPSSSGASMPSSRSVKLLFWMVVPSAARVTPVSSPSTMPVFKPVVVTVSKAKPSMVTPETVLSPSLEARETAVTWKPLSDVAVVGERVDGVCVDDGGGALADDGQVVDPDLHRGRPNVPAATLTVCVPPSAPAALTASWMLSPGTTFSGLLSIRPVCCRPESGRGAFPAPPTAQWSSRCPARH